MAADWHVELDMATILAALRRATVLDARWMRGHAGRQAAAAGKAGDAVQVAVWQRIERAAAARVQELTTVVLVGDEGEVSV